MANRDNYLLETNFDEDGPLTTVSPVPTNQMTNGQAEFIRGHKVYRSTTSVDRYSDTTLHGVPKQGDKSFNSFLVITL